jgi:hypothetical protein
MSKKEQLLLEVARLYKGITVVEFEKKFGKMNEETLGRYIRLVKVISMQIGVML